MISYRQRVNMDPGGKGAPLARRTPKECVFAQPCHVFFTYIHSETATAVSCKAGGGEIRHALFFEACPPLAHGVARSGEHRGRKTQKKELDFCAACGTILEQSRDHPANHARVVELADSLDSGSSVHSGRAGSSPPRAPINGSPQSVEIAGFSFYINGFRVLRGKRTHTIVNVLFTKISK